MPHCPRDGHLADSPAGSRPADFAGVETPLDHATELIATAIRGDQFAIPFDREIFEREAIRVLARPIARAIGESDIGEDPRREAIIHHLLAEAVAGLWREVNGFRYPTLALRCLGLVFRMSAETEKDLAEKFGIKCATVSAICLQLCEHLQVPPGRRSTLCTQNSSARLHGGPLRSQWPFRGMMSRVKATLAHEVRPAA